MFCVPAAPRPRGWSLALALLTAPALAGCQDYPKDIADTYRQVEARGELRAGIVSAPADTMAREHALAARLAEEEGVALHTVEDSSALLVRALEQGEIDVVIGRFARETPWSGRVGISGAAGGGKPEKTAPVLRALVRAGENRWLMRVDRHLGGMD
ncbi:hypothetical protein [Sphingosinithalassobacter sp. LHW66-3]|uniref:hypothetical protein n=1 Tax=Sphingosinithalassobacter sp. LHW66-3 TaxID=3424718 RepID=UPI003D6AB6FE